MIGGFLTERGASLRVAVASAVLVCCCPWSATAVQSGGPKMGIGDEVRFGDELLRRRVVLGESWRQVFAAVDSHALQDYVDSIRTRAGVLTAYDAEVFEITYQYELLTGSMLLRSSRDAPSPQYLRQYEWYKVVSKDPAPFLHKRSDTSFAISTELRYYLLANGSGEAAKVDAAKLIAAISQFVSPLQMVRYLLMADPDTGRDIGRRTFLLTYTREWLATRADFDALVGALAALEGVDVEALVGREKYEEMQQCRIFDVLEGRARAG